MVSGRAPPLISMSLFPHPGLSHVVGQKTVDLLEHTIGEALSLAARNWPDVMALVSPAEGVSWTWCELDLLATNVAANLLSGGSQPGDRIGIWALNRADWVLMQLAAARTGLILVTINPAYRPQELSHVLRLADIALLIVSTPFKTSDYAEMVAEAVPELRSATGGQVAAIAFPSLRRVYGIAGAGSARLGDLDALRAPPSARALRRLGEVSRSLSANDAINIQFTSGTTGAPKGATLSHRNILNNGANLGRTLSLSPADRLCLPVPLYHCFGMVMGVLACLTSGCTIVLPGEGFDPSVVIATILREGCTVLYGVPTMFMACVREVSASNTRIDSLRAGVMAGALCPMELMQASRTELGIRDLIIAYGMTETSPVSFQTCSSDPLEMQISTVGRIQPHIEGKIVGADGMTLPAGSPGELCTYGYSVMLGYWNQPAQTAAAIDADGWMHTGDIAVIDAEGYCRIVGRIKDMIIRGGENIYPAEIEAYLRQHPAIREVEVVGVPDPAWGEIVCACVVAENGWELTADDVRDFCRGRIAHYKVPERVVFVESFPMTVTGKIQKNVLREIVSHTEMP